MLQNANVQIYVEVCVLSSGIFNNFRTARNFEMNLHHVHRFSLGMI